MINCFYLRKKKKAKQYYLIFIEIKQKYVNKNQLKKKKICFINHI